MPIVKLQGNDAIFNDFAQVMDDSISSAVGDVVERSDRSICLENESISESLTSMSRPNIILNNHSSSTSILKTDTITLNPSQLTDLQENFAEMQREINFLRENNSQLVLERDNLRQDLAIIKGNHATEKARNDEQMLEIRKLKEKVRTLNESIKSNNQPDPSAMNASVNLEDVTNHQDHRDFSRLQSVKLTIDEEVLEELRNLDNQHNSANGTTVTVDRLSQSLSKLPGVFRRGSVRSSRRSFAMGKTDDSMDASVQSSTARSSNHVSDDAHSSTHHTTGKRDSFRGKLNSQIWKKNFGSLLNKNEPNHPQSHSNKGGMRRRSLRITSK